ncbi:sacsin N-terminal ATP-binding-like domain-containing protein [Candidatus Palauibacter sp.]|uniref:sacsin N-terminal ATP-binding-like domain-containing protein n=1 Tax=Candidatus Palauibacter sp. TaxID=3101350 RepID=UPI003B51F196
MPTDAGASANRRPEPHDWDRAKTQILALNTAQGVHRHLRTLESNRSRVLPRWIWELLQNARDVSVGNGSLVVSVEVRDVELTFSHNGRGFEPEEITHLIYYGSTKLECDDPIGQFGSGFLTTHLLSPTIEVSGQLTNGQTFDFQLDRGGESVADLQSRMDASFEAFKSSLAPAGDSNIPGARTTFRYRIDERALEAVERGVRALKLSGPYVTAVNQEFKRIQVLMADSGIVLELRKRCVLAEHIKEVEVNVGAPDSAPPQRLRHVVAEIDGVTVAVPFERRGEDMALVSPAGATKLLLGFPLIGTEDFCFPAVVHSLRFSPTEERDGVYLGQSDDQVNRENQAVIKKACELLLLIAEFAATSGWGRTYVLAEVPPVRAQRWLDEGWLRDCLRKHLIDPIRATPSILTESGSALVPNASSLPTANSRQAADRLWSLARALTDLKDALPKQEEAWGWCGAARSWAALYKCDLGELEETMDGRDLAGHARDAGSLSALQDRLGDANAATWLDELHRFLAANGFDDALRNLEIVPDQNGRFNTLQNLHRDRDIADELKEIAQLVGWNLRAKLRDASFVTLSDRPGAGDFDSDYVIPKLIDCLRDRMEKSLDEDSKVASVRLFGWLAAHNHWRHLEGFPAFSDDGDSGTSVKLLRHEDDALERPLAPVRTWPGPLQRYADLFPRRRILADDFAAELERPSVWSALDQRGFLRASVLYARSVSFGEFLPDEPLPEGEEGEIEHKVADAVEVTNVAFLSTKDIGILDRVRQSRKQALLFWDFLTGWLAVEDVQGLEAEESMCVCGSPHRLYPAAWLVPLVRNKWVPLEGRRSDRASAHSLAKLVRNSGWPTDLLQGSPPVVALLKALRVSVPELIMELFATDSEQREALDETLAQLLTSVGSNWDRLQVLAEDIQEDGKLFDHLEERRERRRMVRENQRLGALVEELVKESLEDEDFDVCRTGKGSDFAIQPGSTADDEQIQLKLTRRDRTWLVEIKSARDDSVRMTSVQARTSVEHKSDYLLCVVPISVGPEDPDTETVRRCMRFVDGIGVRLEDICADLDNFESVRESVTVKGAAGLRLELDSGSPRIRIDSTVWEAGFGLEDLFSRLTAAQGGVDRAPDRTPAFP